MNVSVLYWYQDDCTVLSAIWQLCNKWLNGLTSPLYSSCAAVLDSLCYLAVLLAQPRNVIKGGVGLSYFLYRSP